LGTFTLGFLMFSTGIYLLLHSIGVANPFGFGYGLYHFGFFGSTWSITSGMILLPLFFGVGLVFYNAKNAIGWMLAGGSLVALVAGVLMNLRFVMKPMSLFELLCILTLAVGGLALLLRSLRDTSPGRGES
jgi:hypothetical protein